MLVSANHASSNLDEVLACFKRYGWFTSSMPFVLGSVAWGTLHLFGVRSLPWSMKSYLNTIDCFHRLISHSGHRDFIENHPKSKKSKSKFINLSVDVTIKKISFQICGTQFLQLRREAWSNQDFNGFERVTSRFRIHAHTNWASKPLMSNSRFISYITSAMSCSFRILPSGVLCQNGSQDLPWTSNPERSKH